MSGAPGYGESTPARQRKEDLTSWEPSESPEGEAGERWRQWFWKVAFAQSEGMDWKEREREQERTQLGLSWLCTHFMLFTLEHLPQAGR